MNNKVDLTDEELNAIQYSLQLTITNHNNYVRVNGAQDFDITYLETLTRMREIHKRFNKLYFMENNEV